MSDIRGKWTNQHIIGLYAIIGKLLQKAQDLTFFNHFTNVCGMELPDVPNYGFLRPTCLHNFVELHSTLIIVNRFLRNWLIFYILWRYKTSAGAYTIIDNLILTQKKPGQKSRKVFPKKNQSTCGVRGECTSYSLIYIQPIPSPFPKNIPT